jgi:hypothetical protein
MPCIHDLAPKFDILCVTDVTSRDNKQNFGHPKKIDRTIIKEPADSDNGGHALYHKELKWIVVFISNGYWDK